MAIEFRCTECQKLLRTGDDTAGKQAKCPECGSLTTVPSATETPGEVPPEIPPPPPPETPGSPFGARGPEPSSSADPNNPYASPAAFPAPATPFATGHGELNPTIIDFGDIFSRTWEIFKVHWGMCLVVLVIVFLINMAFNVTVSVGMNLMAMAGGDPFLALAFSLVGNVCTTLFGIWLSIGQTIYFLKICRGQQAEIGEIFRGGPYFLPVLGASILVGLIVILGFALLIVPGVIFSLMFAQYYYLIIDRKVGVMESLDVSRQLMVGNKLTLFAINLVATLLGMLVILCTCGLGALAVVPFLALLYAVVYLAITGQPTADQMMARTSLG